jgi:cystathionine gamma-synthase
MTDHLLETQTDSSAANSTDAVHGGTPRSKPFGAISTPIVQTATYTFTSSRELKAYMQRKFGRGDADRVEYGRYGNPTIEAAEAKIAALNGADAAILYASGMAAVTSVLFTLLRPGLHIVLTDDCYRHTHDFCLGMLTRYGVETTVVPMGDYAAMEAAIIPRKTRVILTESPTNPYLRVADLERVAALGKQHGALTMIDSTFATPVNQRPLEWGIDLVMHSATKYLAGHNDLLAGVVVGRKERIDALRETRGLLGSVVDPQNAWLLERGLKTLALRVGQQNCTAQRVAEYLETHPKIERVWYPGLASHPDHDIARAQMRGFGGVVTFEVRGDLQRTSDFIDALRIPYIAASLGGVESLIQQPALMSHFEKTPEERAQLGIKDNLVRFAIGIEDADDILDDLEQALAVI